MKFTLGWLKDHLDTSASLQQIADALVRVGLEVESITDRAATYAPFKVVQVAAAEKHPDADRLKVCVVDTGTEKLQVVCGAPNARAGMKAIFAPVGSLIPASNTVLKKGNIRGQESNGMLVSEAEMALPITLPDGIIEVAADTPIGTSLADIYGLADPVIDIAITPNRADACSIRGVARDLAASGLGTLKPLDTKAVAGTFDSAIKVDLKFAADTQNACPLFLGRMVKGVKNGPSPAWLQARLKAIGLRPISTLVDITNYLTYALGRPLHVFDADKIKGNIHARLAKNGESFEALNGKAYTLTDQMVAICDDTGVLGLGGIVGGTSTGCTDDTVNVYIECAYFDPLRIARTGRALQIDSDARYRFERGVDPAFLGDGMEIATRLVMELCGGTPSHVVQAGAVPAWQRQIAYRPQRVESLGGRTMPETRQKEILAALGFSVDNKAAPWQITPPSWRGDVAGEADIVEELLRIDGFDHIPATSLPRTDIVAQAAETALGDRARKARVTLASRGLQECVTWSFLPKNWAQMFGGGDASLTINNPINAEMDQMRPSPLPNLIQAAARNAARGNGACALFEVGPGFFKNKPDGQNSMAAGVRAGTSGARHWSGAGTSRAVDVYDAKADALAVLEMCGITPASVQVDRNAPAWYHPGRSGTIKLGQQVIAQFGEVYPSVAEALDAHENVVAFEVYLDRLPAPKKKAGAARPALKLNPLQPVVRDFAFVVAAATEAEVMLRAARGADKTLITDAQIFDVYQGKGVEAGKKSVALTITVQPQDKTLTDAEIDALAQRVVAAVAEKTGASLRS